MVLVQASRPQGLMHDTRSMMVGKRGFRMLDACVVHMYVRFRPRGRGLEEDLIKYLFHDESDAASPENKRVTHPVSSAQPQPQTESRSRVQIVNSLPV